MNTLGDAVTNLRQRRVPAAEDLENQQPGAHALSTMPGAFPE
jgi:hypothetical protein